MYNKSIHSIGRITTISLKTYYKNAKAEQFVETAFRLDELRKKYDALANTHKGLGDRVSIAEGERKIAINKVSDLEGKLTIATHRVRELEAKEKIIIPENIELATLRNKNNKIVGKVNAARRKIEALNASTPYRPGAVERALADVMEDLRNV